MEKENTQKIKSNNRVNLYLSPKRDKDLIQYIELCEEIEIDDLSFGLRELMRDGVKYRNQTGITQESPIPSKAIKSNPVENYHPKDEKTGESAIIDKKVVDNPSNQNKDAETFHKLDHI